MTYLAAAEPAEITWGPDGIEVVAAVDREWWAEPLAYRAKQMGPKP